MYRAKRISTVVRSGTISAVLCALGCLPLAAYTNLGNNVLLSDGSAADTQAAMNAAGTGYTVQLPAGSFQWTTGVTWSAPAGASLIGAGTTATGGGDRTVIIDNIASGSQLFNIKAAATGVFRFSGITIQS